MESSGTATLTKEATSTATEIAIATTTAIHMITHIHQAVGGGTMNQAAKANMTTVQKANT